MKIHEYNEMMRHLTRREPSDKHLAAMPLYEQGGRVGFKRGSGNPIPITDKTLETVNKLIKGSSKSLKEIGRDLGYAADLRSDSYIIKAYEDKFGKKLLDEMAQEKYNKNFRDLDKNNQLKFFKSQLNKYEDFIKENKRYPNPTEAYNIGLTQGGKKSSILTDEVKTKI